MKVDMGQFRDFVISGEERNTITKRIFNQADEWGLRIPEVEYLMVHFGLNDFFKTGETEFWVSNEIEAGYCSKLIFVFDGQTCPYHFHKIKHETFYIVKGKTKMKVDGKNVVKKTGDILAVPTGTRHSFEGLGPCLLLETSMPSVPGDSFFENKEIGDNGVL